MGFLNGIFVNIELMLLYFLKKEFLNAFFF